MHGSEFSALGRGSLGTPNIDPRTFNAERDQAYELGTWNTELLLDAQSLSSGFRSDHVKMVEHGPGRLANAQRLDESGGTSTGKSIGQVGGALCRVLGDRREPIEHIDRRSLHDMR